MGIESVLKAGIKALPEKTTIKGKQLPNALKKMGVKDEELKFADLAIQPEKKYTKAELEELEAGRKDVFGYSTQDPGNAGYQWVSLEKGKSNPTYKENVYTFSDMGAKPKVNTGDIENIKDILHDYVNAGAEDLQDDVIDILTQHGMDGATVNELGVPEAARRLSETLGKPTKSRYTSEHFPDVPNYLMHTRTFDDMMDGKPTRVLQEIQSDLHQQGRVQGYDLNIPTPNAKEMEDATRLAKQDEIDYEAHTKEDFERLDELLEKFGYTNERMEELDIPIYEALADIGRGITAHPSGGAPKSPYEKSWLAKGIERELDSAIEDGRQQLAIPIKGAEIENLKRAPGVQKWYEGNVVNTAKKIAKQNGMDFELTPTTKGTTESFGSLDNLEMNLILKEYEDARITGGPEVAYDTAIDVLRDTIGARMDMPEGMLDDTLIAMLEGKPIASVNDVLMTRPQAQTQYAIIKPKGEIVPASTPEEIAEFEKFVTDQGFKGESTLAHIERVRAEFKAGKLKAERPNLKLYSSPAAAVGAGYASLKAGGTDDDVRFELSQAGYDSDEAEEILSDAKFAQESVDVHGDSEEEVMAFFKSQEPEIAERTSAPIDQPTEKSFWESLRTFGYTEDTEAQFAKHAAGAKKRAYAALIEAENTSAEQLLSRLQVIRPNMSSITTRFSGYFGNETDAKKQEEAVLGAAQQIVNLAAQHGKHFIYKPNIEAADYEKELTAFGGGHWYRIDEQGREVPLEESFWEAIRQESGEIGLAIAGGYGGFKAAGAISKHPIALFGGSLLGAALGGSVGTEIDYLRDSIALHEEMSANVAAHKALTAAEASVIGDLVGYPLAKGAGAIWRATKRAKDFLLDGNTTGAYKALKDTMFLDESEITDITNSLNKATARDTSAMKPLEERIQATVLTQPGGEAIVKAAGSIDPQAGAAVAKAIDTRAKDILATTAELTDENVGRILAQDLSNYTADVKQYYSDVKELVAKSPRINDFSWDYEKLAIKPVLETLQKNIMDPAVLERFALQSERINSMADSRTLTDLLELRQLVNDFKFNKRITKVKDFDALNEVINNIDGAIKQGAEVVMEDPKQWLSNYTLAKTQYAKMKGLERNVIARALRRPGLTEESAVKALTKYITSIDGTFQDIMTSLPKESRKLTEGAVIDTLANKFTAGTEGGQRAMHFPLLASELDKITFTTPKARQAKAALKEMAEVFKNDIPLSQSTGNIQIPKFQSYLTVDPVVRAKFEIASSMFNWIKKMAPTSEQRNMALVSKTAKLLENPLNARLMKEVMEEVKGDVQLSKQLLDLQKQVAMSKDVGSAKVKLYGEGKVLSGKGEGKAQEIPIHRIATYEMQQTIANKYGIDLADKKLMDQALKGEGYMAVQQGSDKVRKL